MDKLLTALLVVFLIVDWSQTRYIAKNPDKFYEMNPLLGKHPSVLRVNLHFFLALLLALIPGYPIITFIWWAMEVALVVNNYRIGIKLA